MFLRATPAPIATLCNGSSAMWNGMLIFSCKRLVETAQQSAATTEVDTVLDDVGIEFWRSAFECREYGVLDLCNGLVDAVCYLLIAYGNLHRQSCDAVRSVYDEVFGSLIAPIL